MTMPKLIAPIDATVIVHHPTVIGMSWSMDVTAGETYDVPEWAVGRPEDPSRVEAMRELAACSGSQQHAERAALVEELVGLDPGEGLLLQGWTLADAPAAGKKSKKSTKPTPEEGTE
jgi:hypothetical protein